MFKGRNWQQLESGQALMEYWPTIPAAIMIVISAGLVVSFLRGSLTQATDGLNRASAGVRIEVCETTEDNNGGQSSFVGTHNFEFVGSTYDGENTTIVYRVSSSEKYALSHWVLGISKEVADNIIDQSEPWEWTNNDPTTGAVGIKFDTGYGEGDSSKDTSDESSEGKDKQKGNNGVGNGEDPQPPGNPPVNDGEGTSPGNPGNKGGADTTDTGKTNKGKSNKQKTFTSQLSHLYLLQDKSQTTFSLADGETREIFLVLSGSYDFNPVTVTTKSANLEPVVGTISGPVISATATTETEIEVIYEGCD